MDSDETEDKNDCAGEGQQQFSRLPTSQLIFTGTIAVYCENHMKHVNALRWQNIAF
jgi:hypothetical protein